MDNNNNQATVSVDFSDVPDVNVVIIGLTPEGEFYIISVNDDEEAAQYYDLIPI